MNAATLLPSLILFLGCMAFVFWPNVAARAVEKTRLDYLRERRDVLYDSLRDLSFEFRSGKFSEADFAAQRDSLEGEAARVLTEMETLGG